MPQLILISFLLFAAWLIRRDTRKREGISTALWIPTLWIGILSSRPVSAWLGGVGSGDSLDGSPLDRLFYLAIIVASIVILVQRQVDWGRLLGNNWPLVLLYGFFFLSVLWAFSPFVSFKRWFKEVGNIFVVLVILTEANPREATKAVFIRCTYVLVPLSLIFVRYFPDLGRRYSPHTGGLEVIGVTFQKNSLGTMLLVCGVIFLWDWIERSRDKSQSHPAVDRYVPMVIAGLILYLFQQCDSKTSMIALLLAGGITVTLKFPAMQARVKSFGIYLLFAAVVLFLLDRMVGVSEWIITSMGRDMTFTGRTEVWNALFAVGTDPLLGTGFMSFWDDPNFRSKLPYWVGGSAHNGYIEIYLFGGYVGLAILAIALLGIGAAINRDLRSGREYSVVRFAILVATLVANFAESNFVCMTPLGFLFIIAAIGDGRLPVGVHQPADISPSFPIGNARAPKAADAFPQ